MIGELKLDVRSAILRVRRSQPERCHAARIDPTLTRLNICREAGTPLLIPSSGRPPAMAKHACPTRAGGRGPAGAPMADRRQVAGRIVLISFVVQGRDISRIVLVRRSRKV